MAAGLRIAGRARGLVAPMREWAIARNTVFVEADPARIDQALESRAAVRDLVENGWVRLFALSPNGAMVARRVPGLGWEPFTREVEAVPRQGSEACPR